MFVFGKQAQLACFGGNDVGTVMVYAQHCVQSWCADDGGGKGGVLAIDGTENMLSRRLQGNPEMLLWCSPPLSY